MIICPFVVGLFHLEMSSSFIRATASGFPSVLRLSNIPLCVQTTSSLRIHPSDTWVASHLGCCEESCGEHGGADTPQDPVLGSCGHKPRGGITRSYLQVWWYLLRSLHTVCRRRNTVLQAQWQHPRAPVLHVLANTCYFHFFL